MARVDEDHYVHSAEMYDIPSELIGQQDVN